MARRGVRLILLCEDDEHQRFARYALLKLGFDSSELRVFVCPSGRGAAEKWVRNRYAEEVRLHRRRARFQRVGLVVVVDADRWSVKERHEQLSIQLKEAELAERSPKEAILIWVPARHIETWVAYLLGRVVTEADDCKDLVRGVDYRSPAARFVDLYQKDRDRPSDVLPSILCAFAELRAA